MRERERVVLQVSQVRREGRGEMKESERERKGGEGLGEGV